MTTLRMSDILTNYRNQDCIPWDQFFTYLRTFEHSKIALIASLMATGKARDPIVVTDRGDVIDGHHRLCVMQSLGVLEVDAEVVDANDFND